MELLKIVEKLKAKVQEDEKSLIKIKTNRENLQVRVGEMAKEIKTLLNAETIEEAFEKLKAITILEGNLENKMLELLDAYNKADTSRIAKLSSEVNIIVSEIEGVKNGTKDPNDVSPIEEHKEDVSEEIIDEVIAPKVNIDRPKITINTGVSEDEELID